MLGPGVMITSRSIRLRSWRTLPGQACASSAARHSGVSSRGRSPDSAQNCCTKWRARIAMSSRRSRNGGTREGDHVEPVVEVLAEAARRDLLLEILVRRGDHAHVDLDRLGSADALEAVLLEDAQDLRLRHQAHVGDLVEEDRAAVGQLELAPLLGERAGEGALLVTEELRLDQLLRQRGAVHLHERALAASALEVDLARDELLARAVLAGDQHPGVGGPRHLDLLLEAHDRFGAAEDLVRAQRLRAQTPVLGLEARALERVLERQAAACRSRAASR